MLVLGFLLIEPTFSARCSLSLSWSWRCLVSFPTSRPPRSKLQRQTSVKKYINKYITNKLWVSKSPKWRNVNVVKCYISNLLDWTSSKHVLRNSNRSSIWDTERQNTHVLRLRHWEHTAKAIRRHIKLTAREHTDERQLLSLVSLLQFTTHVILPASHRDWNEFVNPQNVNRFNTFFYPTLFWSKTILLSKRSRKHRNELREKRHSSSLFSQLLHIPPAITCDLQGPCLLHTLYQNTLLFSNLIYAWSHTYNRSRLFV